MGSSKRKASFRIDDILQQHQQLQQQGSPSPEPITNLIEKPSRSSQSTPELVIDDTSRTMNPNQSALNKTEVGALPPAAPTATAGVHHGALVEPAHPSPSSGSDGAPRKPHPVYPSSFPDMQKHAPNFYLPFSLGMPQFSPAAAYLEHYANALQKGERINSVEGLIGI